MLNFYFSAFSCVCVFQAGLCAAECETGVLARRETFYVPAGSSLSLSCVVQHCEGPWKGNWTWVNITDQSQSRIVGESARHHPTSVAVNANKTQLQLKILNVDQSDEGSYRCNVHWHNGETGVGHGMQVNVIKAVQRPFWHRVLICASASLCLPIFLGLARCLSSRIRDQPRSHMSVRYRAGQTNQEHIAPNPPQPPPRCPVPKKRSIPTHKAHPKPQMKTEVVYAYISQEALGQHEARREAAQATVYSSVKFS